MYFALRAAERYGCGGCGRGDPLGWWDALPVAVQRLLLVMERVRTAEEERVIATMVAVSGGRKV